jgi:hypothetical protein
MKSRKSVQKLVALSILMKGLASASGTTTEAVSDTTITSTSSASSSASSSSPSLSFRRKINGINQKYQNQDHHDSSTAITTPATAKSIDLFSTLARRLVESYDKYNSDNKNGDNEYDNANEKEPKRQNHLKDDDLREKHLLYYHQQKTMNQNEQQQSTILEANTTTSSSKNNKTPIIAPSGQENENIISVGGDATAQTRQSSNYNIIDTTSSTTKQQLRTSSSSSSSSSSITNNQDDENNVDTGDTIVIVFDEENSTGDNDLETNTNEALVRHSFPPEEKNVTGDSIFFPLVGEQTAKDINTNTTNTTSTTKNVFDFRQPDDKDEEVEETRGHSSGIVNTRNAKVRQGFIVHSVGTIIVRCC